jgi:hypothetical protein
VCLLAAGRASTGRPAKDRAAPATAFVAKAILNLPTTRDLIDRLRVDLHAAVIEATQRPRLIGHIARDSTAIPARERVPEALMEKKRAAKKEKKKATRGKPKHPKGAFTRAKARERGTPMKQLRQQKLSTMLPNLPQQCDIGAKRNSHGNEEYWRGYKLHLDVADGQLPISAVLTSASVHDSQVAIPLMTLTSQRVDYLYELMDSAYDAEHIHGQSRQLNHVPIIAIHGRVAPRSRRKCRKCFPRRRRRN